MSDRAARVEADYNAVRDYRMNMSQAERALLVMILDPDIRAFLEEHDPQALRQARLSLQLPAATYRHPTMGTIET